MLMSLPGGSLKRHPTLTAHRRGGDGTLSSVSMVKVAGAACEKLLRRDSATAGTLSSALITWSCSNELGRDIFHAGFG